MFVLGRGWKGPIWNWGNSASGNQNTVAFVWGKSVLIVYGGHENTVNGVGATLPAGSVDPNEADSYK